MYKITKFINGNFEDICNIYKKFKYYYNKIFINKNILLKEIYENIFFDYITYLQMEIVNIIVYHIINMEMKI